VVHCPSRHGSFGGKGLVAKKDSSKGNSRTIRFEITFYTQHQHILQPSKIPLFFIHSTLTRTSVLSTYLRLFYLLLFPPKVLFLFLFYYAKNLMPHLRLSFVVSFCPIHTPIFARFRTSPFKSFLTDDSMYFCASPIFYLAPNCHHIISTFSSGFRMLQKGGKGEECIPNFLSNPAFFYRVSNISCWGILTSCINFFSLDAQSIKLTCIYGLSCLVI
jgi:hypothetical protein